MEKKNKSTLWGGLLVLVGLVYLGTNLELWNINIFFEGWWTLFIIVPSVISLINKENAVSSSLGIIAGFLLLLAARDYIEWSMVGKIFLPFAIISLGLSLMFKPKINIGKKRNSNNPSYIGIFAGHSEKVLEIFKGASCVAVFGAVELDLSAAKITEDLVIDCVSVFGGVDITLPKDVIVKTEGIAILGGNDNKYQSDDKNKKHTVFINYVSVFGGTTIK